MIRQLPETDVIRDFNKAISNANTRLDINLDGDVFTIKSLRTGITIGTARTTGELMHFVSGYTNGLRDGAI